MSRQCEMCGKKMTAGMTNGIDFYCHEGKCFRKYMNKMYGKYRWMALDDPIDGYGGYYIHAESGVVGGFIGTGIYYTEWEDEDE